MRLTFVTTEETIARSTLVPYICRVKGRPLIMRLRQLSARTSLPDAFFECWMCGIAVEGMCCRTPREKGSLSPHKPLLCGLQIFLEPLHGAPN